MVWCLYYTHGYHATGDEKGNTCTLPVDPSVYVIYINSFQIQRMLIPLSFR